MNQSNRRMCDEQQKRQINNNKLQRSVSPICKLVVLKNINADVNENVQKSIRAKDDTIILDVILHLEKCYSNNYKITLYYQNKKIDVDKNTYLLPYLSKLKTQQIDYKIHEKDTDSTQTGTDDECPNLDRKLQDKDSSDWGIKLKHGKNQSKQEQELNEIFLESNVFRKELPDQEKQLKHPKEQHKEKQETNKIYTQQKNVENQEIQQQSSIINESLYTYKSIGCRCGRSYNSQQLKEILQLAILQNHFAKCQSCNQNITSSMYLKIETGQQYHQLKSTLELQIMISQSLNKFQKCKYCSFFCIWDKSKSIQKGFCPLCLEYIMTPKNH